MKSGLYKYVKYVSDHIPLEVYRYVIRQRLILPFYHSVTDSPLPHIRNLGYYRSKADFIQDITWFKQHYCSVPINRIRESRTTNAFHLSFDDGLAELFTEAVPLLLNEKVDATFFINSDLIDNKSLFYRHKVALLEEAVKSKENHHRLAGFLKLEEPDLRSYLYGLKSTDEKLIDAIAQELKISFEDYLRKHTPYLTTEQLRIMKDMGFAIGNHGKSHVNFAGLPLKEQQSELAVANRFLAAEIGMEDFYFSFPFGDVDIKNDFFEFMYQEENISLSFGIAGLKEDDYPLHLHRIPMEFHGYSAEQIIKFECFYYVLKFFFNRNKIRRKN